MGVSTKVRQVWPLPVGMEPLQPQATEGGLDRTDSQCLTGGNQPHKDDLVLSGFGRLGLDPRLF